MFEFIYLTTPAHLWLILHSYVTSNFSAKLCVLAAKPIIIRCSSPPHSQHVMRLALRLWFQTWQTSPMAFCLWGNLTQSHHRQESCVCVSLSLSSTLPFSARHKMVDIYGRHDRSQACWNIHTHSLEDWHFWKEKCNYCGRISVKQSQVDEVTAVVYIKGFCSILL